MSKQQSTESTIVMLDHSGMLGGGQLSLMRYLVGSSKRNSEVVLLEGGPLVDRLKATSVPVHVLDGRQGKLGAILKVRKLRAFLKTSRSTQAVVANSLRTGFLLPFLRVKGQSRVLYVREDVSPASLGRLKRLLLRWVVFPSLDGVIVNSESTRRSLGADVLRKTKTAIAYPVSGLTSTPQRTERHAGPLHVLSMSRLYPWKGIDVLIAAATVLAQKGLSAEFEFVIAGDAIFGDQAYAESLREAAAVSGASIAFVGHVDNVAPLLAEADVLTLCSVTPEAFGQVLPQAMSSGVAVVATAHGGPTEIISDGVDGLLVAPGDAEELATALLQLAKNPETLNAMATQGVIRSRSFRDEATIPGFEKALASLLR